jgi:hypothetical protein
MQKERKNVAEAGRAMLEKIRNAERFQHEAIQRDKTTHAQLTELKAAVARKEPGN